MKLQVRDILEEDDRRLKRINAYFDPLTGEGSVGERVELHLDDFPIHTQFIPVDMMRNGLVKLAAKCGSMREMVRELLELPEPYKWSQQEWNMVEREVKKVKSRLIRVRIKYDFPFWAAFLAKIKKKGGGDDINFVLNRPQRKLVAMLEEYRRAGMPIRIVLLKARQWGGSTCIQMYMAWLQLVHEVGLNSLIVGHVGATSTEVEDMFKKMLQQYPAELLHAEGEEYDDDEQKWVGVGQAANIHRVPQRNCKIKLGTAERPDSARGGDYNLVHCTECGLWKKTEGKTPEDIMQGATDGILLKAMTMIVLESTAKGVGNFFHTEYLAAKAGISQYAPLFVAWWEIDQYSMEFAFVGEARANTATQSQRTGPEDGGQGGNAATQSQRTEQGGTGTAGQRGAGTAGQRGAGTEGQGGTGQGRSRKEMTREEFAAWLLKNKDNESAPDERHESGSYLWWLWELGASLEAINWYVHEREGKNDSARMRSEYPSDDIEAFVNSGANVFDKVLVDRFRKMVKPAKWIGELEGDIPLGGMGMTDGTNMSSRGRGNRRLLEGLHFVHDSQGALQVWSEPEPDDENEIIKNRYLVVVDVGGRGTKADWSVICVFDRFGMLVGDKPSVVAQWYGHIDMDLLAWKAAQIARWYNDALLVIESNTLETKDKDRMVDGDQTEFILLQLKEAYSNLYARKQTEEAVKEGAPVKYGFHTNVSTKPMVISALVSAVREYAYVERDGGTLDEFCVYERKQNGSYGAIVGKHDDKLMTRAIGLFICFYDMPMPKIVSRQERRTSRVKKIVREED